MELTREVPKLDVQLAGGMWRSVQVRQNHLVPSVMDQWPFICVSRFWGTLREGNSTKNWHFRLERRWSRRISRIFRRSLSNATAIFYKGEIGFQADIANWVWLDGIWQLYYVSIRHDHHISHTNLQGRQNRENVGWNRDLGRWRRWPGIFRVPGIRSGEFPGTGAPNCGGLFLELVMKQ